MPPKKVERLCFEKIIGVGRGFGYVNGQDVAETQRQLKRMFNPPRFSDSTVEKLMQLADPTYMITKQDQAERMERRALSERARINCFEFAHYKAAVVGRANVDRGLNMLYKLGGGEEADKFNQRVDAAFGRDNMNQYNDMMAERTQMMKEFIDEVLSDDYSDLFNISDQKLVERFPRMFRAYLMAAEGGDAILGANKDPINNPGGPTHIYELGPEYAGKLRQFRDQYQGLMADLKNRFDMIMDPNYELIHSERVVAPHEDHEPGESFTNGENPLSMRMEKSKRVGEESYLLYPDLNNFGKTFINAYTMPGFGWLTKLKHFAEVKGLDPNNFEISKMDGEVIPHYEGPGGPYRGLNMFFMKDVATGKVIMVKSDGFRLSEVDPRKAYDMTRGSGDAVMKALEDADPWHIRTFTSSDEYEAMKAQMKIAKEAVDSLTRNYSDEEFLKVTAELKALENMCNAYLEKKINTEGVTEITKDSERRRVRGAMDAKEYAQQTFVLLDTRNKLNLERETSTNKNNEGMEAQAKEEAAFAKPRSFLKTDRAYEQEQAQAQSQKKVTSITDFNALQQTEEGKKQIEAQRQKQREEKQVKEFYNGFMPGDPLGRLAGQIYQKKDVAAKDEAERAERIAQMVTMDIILRERQGSEKREIGEIEKIFRAAPEQFVQGLTNSSVVQDFARNGDDKYLADMVKAAAKGGIQKLTNQVLKEQGVEIQKAQQPELQNQMQNQQVVQGQPEVPKVNLPGGN